MAISVRRFVIACCVAVATAVSVFSIPAVTQASPPATNSAAPSFITGPVGGSPLPTPAPSSYCMAVVTRPTNFRTGPSTRYHIIRLLPTYTVLKAYGRRGAWLDVADSRGKRGWVWQPNIRISSMCAAKLANH